MAREESAGGWQVEEKGEVERGIGSCWSRQVAPHLPSNFLTFWIKIKIAATAAQNLSDTHTETGNGREREKEAEERESEREREAEREREEGRRRQ
jgi:hypothetical protein